MKIFIIVALFIGLCACVKGPQGERGQAGEQGEQGLQGSCPDLKVANDKISTLEKRIHIMETQVIKKGNYYYDSVHRQEYHGQSYFSQNNVSPCSVIYLVPSGDMSSYFLMLIFPLEDKLILFLVSFVIILF